MLKEYYIQTRTSHGWHRLFTDNYPSLEEASKGIERHLDSMFFEHGEMLPTSIFRIVKCKSKFQKVELQPGYVITPSILDYL